MTETIPKRSIRKLPDGGYDNRPLDPHYYKNYYHGPGSEMTTCPHCGTECRKNYLSKHRRTNKCKKELDALLDRFRNTMPELDF